MGRKRGWTDEQFIEAVKVSISVAQVLRAIGLKPAGSNYSFVQVHIERLGLSTSHFLGQAWNVGGTHPGKAIPLSEILVENCTYQNRAYLKVRLIRDGLLRNECYECGITEWRGKPLVLQLEHKNGKPRDYRIENLSLLCPNCHSQTDTYAGRNRSARISGWADGSPAGP